MNVFFLAATVDPFETTVPAVKAIGPALRQWLLLMGAILAVAGVVLLYFLFSGKSRRHRARREERRQRREAFRRNLQEAEQRSAKPAGQRRRRRHHRPRNPTLAETGGLPPVRGQEPEAQSPSH